MLRAIGRKHLLTLTAWTLIAIATVPITAGCQNSEQKSASQDVLTVTDDYGRTVTTPAHPRRVVSTSPAVTEIIFAIGGGGQLVGRTDYCHYPTEAERIESIGGISNLNIEKVLSLQPDVVISGSMIPKKVTAQLEKLGVPTVCVIEKKHFEGLYENIQRIGLLIGKKGTADSLAAKLKETLEATRQKATSEEKWPSLYYVVGYGTGGDYTAGGDSYINDIIRLAGYRNIAEKVRGWSFSTEALMSADPDYILIRREDSASFAQKAPYNRLTAVKKGRIIGIESGMIDVQVPRNIVAIEEMAAARQ